MLQTVEQPCCLLSCAIGWERCQTCRMLSSRRQQPTVSLQLASSVALLPQEGSFCAVNAASPITAHLSLAGDFERDRGYESQPRGVDRRPPPIVPRLAPRGGGGLDVTHRYLPGGAPPRARPSASRSACLLNSC